MKRKLKIMTHQVDQLKEEISAKESALVKLHLEQQRIEKEKETLKVPYGLWQKPRPAGIFPVEAASCSPEAPRGGEGGRGGGAGRGGEEQPRKAACSLSC